MTSPIAHTFLKAWSAGKCCLHPTDTIPGLSANPEHPEFPHMVENLKGDRSQKNFVTLAPTLQLAMRFWQPLPGDWAEQLAQLWPGPLTVVWKGHNAPPKLLSSDGCLAIRVPKLEPHNLWLQEVMTQANTLLPSTSVNASGEAAKTTWTDAADFVRQSADTYVPDYMPATTNSQFKPSTIIKILSAERYTLLRSGALSLEQLNTSKRCEA